MTPTHVVQITTPKKFILNGLWFGPKKAETVIIFIHGLAGSIFGETEKKLVQPFIGSKSSVLLFNNRGHDIVSKLYGEAPNTKKGYKRVIAGAAHEVFTDCVDDIEGAVKFAENYGAKKIVLVGHSTGCQKSVYWASKKGNLHPKVRAITLLAPVSDRSAYVQEFGEKKVRQVEALANAQIKRGHGTQLMSHDIWPNTADAQRVVSLIAAQSEEEIFLYAQPARVPKTLQKVKIPLLVVWAEHEEHESRPVHEVLNWFERNLRHKHRTVSMPKVGHSFNGAEKAIAKAVAAFMKER